MDRKRSILVVEDERIVARDIQRSLVDLGYDVPTTAASAEQAIRLASERCPSLVLMDVQIKGDRDGIETAKLLRQRFDVPIVYLTAFSDPATVERAKVTEPYGYLLKPVKTNELRSVVEVAIYKHELDRQHRRRERWYSTTLHSIADAVISVDLAGNVTFMNRVAEELTGVSVAKALGVPASDVLNIRNRDSERLLETPIDQALRERRTVVFEQGKLIHAGSGVVRSINDSAAPVIDNDEVIGAVMVFRDVTHQKRLQQQLDVADRLASLETMAAGVAHEVNNPLSVVAANGAFVIEQLEQVQSQLVNCTSVPATNVALLQGAIEAQLELQSAAYRISRIIADLRAFSKQEREPPRPVDARHAIEWALRATADEVKTHARVVTRIEEVPRVDADETRLGQVMINLLTNAAQSIAPGNPAGNEISVNLRSDEAHVIVEVRDTGAGIPDDVRGKIFEPFFTTKPAGVGTGLGLSICQGIVAAVDGCIEFESEVGRGTTFRVLLPVPQREMPVGEAPRSTVSGNRRGRLLLIDDEEIVLRSVARILAPHEVICRREAADALGLLEHDSRFDIIFCDLTMPRMSGIDFYEALLRARPEIAARVVFLTAGATTPAAADFLATIPNVRVQKPFEVADLRALVQQVLAARGQEGPRGSAFLH
jgi:two-component system, cell cycle sensor histidine kinase and response regulator CckA